VAPAPVDEFVAFVLDQRQDFLVRHRTGLDFRRAVASMDDRQRQAEAARSVAVPHALSLDLRGSLFLYAGFTGRVRTVFLFPAPS
jgi:hypothetical protein